MAVAALLFADHKTLVFQHITQTTALLTYLNSDGKTKEYPGNELIKYAGDFDSKAPYLRQTFSESSLAKADHQKMPSVLTDERYLAVLFDINGKKKVLVVNQNALFPHSLLLFSFSLALLVPLAFYQGIRRSQRILQETATFLISGKTNPDFRYNRDIERILYALKNTQTRPPRHTQTSRGISQANAPHNILETETNALLNNSMDSVLIFNSSGIIVNANREAFKFFKAKEPDFKIRHIKQLIPKIGSRNPENTHLTYDKLGETQFVGIGQQNAEALTIDSQIVPVTISCHPFQIDGEKFYLMYVRDISSTLRYQLKLDAYRTHLEYLAEEKAINPDHDEHHKTTEAAKNFKLKTENSIVFPGAREFRGLKYRVPPRSDQAEAKQRVKLNLLRHTKQAQNSTGKIANKQAFINVIIDRTIDKFCLLDKLSKNILYVQHISGSLECEIDENLFETGVLICLETIALNLVKNDHIVITTELQNKEARITIKQDKHLKSRTTPKPLASPHTLAVKQVFQNAHDGTVISTITSNNELSFKITIPAIRNTAEIEFRTGTGP
ncbi:MAG: hypothetical protein OEZ47_00445 [Gammaproteobacteria bacterium]|nr:hypothetical protein [Gammaproteobacteria bacterium]